MFKALTDANCFLYYDNDLKYRTTSAGSEFRGDVHFDNHTNTGKDVYWDESENKLNFKDSVKATFGDSGDLEIYHDGSNSYISDSGTGALTIEASTLLIENAAGNQNMIQAHQGAAVNLYYAHSKKFETTNTGAIVTGILTATSFSGDGSNLTNLPPSAPVGGSASNKVFFENDKVISVNYQITSTKNAMTAGPVSVNAGIAVTVPSGCSWTIV